MMDFFIFTINEGYGNKKFDRYSIHGVVIVYVQPG